MYGAKVRPIRRGKHLAQDVMQISQIILTCLGYHHIRSDVDTRFCRAHMRSKVILFASRRFAAPYVWRAPDNNLQRPQVAFHPILPGSTASPLYVT